MERVRDGTFREGACGLWQRVTLARPFAVQRPGKVHMMHHTLEVRNGVIRSRDDTAPVRSHPKRAQGPQKLKKHKTRTGNEEPARSKFLYSETAIFAAGAAILGKGGRYKK